MSPIEAAVLAERERWILSTRGKDLPKSDERARPQSNRERHERAMEYQRARRAKWRAQTTDVQAAKALDMLERGAMFSRIAQELGTSNAQAGRLLSRARSLRRVGP